MELLKIISRTVFFYFFIVLIYRLMGKREIGQLGIVDLIVSILIAELVAISIENYDTNIILTVVPILILTILEISFAFLSLKSKKVRKLLDGKPSLIIFKGNINYKEMIKQRYSLDDLLLSMRQQQIKSINEIDYAFLENDGRLSLFRSIDNISGSYPMPLIIDEEIQEDVLNKIKKTKNWLKLELKKQEIKVSEVFYAYYDNEKLQIIKKENLLQL